jgi:O-acetyl-ADP-ribose deacetylase (regulator of RNase III)
MPVTFIRGDITKLEVDAIVNAANNELRGGGGVDGAIHAAAGAEQLHAFCKTLGGCPTGEAKLSPGFNLPAKYIIHTVGPVWQGGTFHEKTLLTSCYIRSLELARENHCRSVAFPLISAGAYGYPYNDALQIAYDTCRRFLTETKADMEIYIVLYLRERSYNANVRRHRDYSRFPDEAAFRRVAEYIREHYHFEEEEAAELETALFDRTDAVPEPVAPKAAAPKPAKKRCAKESPSSGSAFNAQEIPPWMAMPGSGPEESKPSVEAAEDLMEDSMPSAQSDAKESRLMLSMKPFRMAGGYRGKLLRKEDFPVEETFTQLVIRFMREKHMDPPEVYTNACLDRKLFSKILCNMDYQPKKYTAVRLALGLKLSPEETDKLLNAAGYVLSHSKLTDLVISYCIGANKRDVWEVNGLLEDFGLTTI